MNWKGSARLRLWLQCRQENYTDIFLHGFKYTTKYGIGGGGGSSLKIRTLDLSNKKQDSLNCQHCSCCVSFLVFLKALLYHANIVCFNG